MEKSKVYFIKDITPENVVKMYKVLNNELKGKVAVKVHSGEKGNQNYLRPEFLKPIIEFVNGTVVECNTAYEGMRDTTEKHKKLMEEHGWAKYFNVDILDEDGPDKVLTIPDGKVIKKNYVGKNIENYDSMLVVSHFKGHPMGGFGGALKQLSIGVASSKGKRYIHCTGKENGSYEDMFRVNQKEFLEAMADAASGVTDYFKGNIAYINIMCNMSVDCDCCATAKEPCMQDIGILSSLDPVALDQACIDLVKKSKDRGKKILLERINSKKGTHIIDAAQKLGIGSKKYELIEVGFFNNYILDLSSLNKNKKSFIKEDRQSINFYLRLDEYFYTDKGYADLNNIFLSKETKESIRSLQEKDKEIIDLCCTSDNYKKIYSEINFLNKELKVLEDKLRIELKRYIITVQPVSYKEIIGYWLKHCHAGYGVIRVLKNKKTNKFFVMCEECEESWNSPEDAINNINSFITDDFSNLENVTYEELKTLGWTEYVVDKVKK